MKIGEIISLVRTTLRERNQTCALNDQEIYMHLNAIANRIKAENLKKRTKLGYQDYKTICIELEKVKFGDCSCVPDAAKCTVLRTKCEIPNVITSDFKNQLRIYDFGRNEIGYLPFLKGKRLRKDKGLKPYYDIIDKYIYVFLDLNKTELLVQGIWEDVVALEDSCYAKEPCKDIKEIEFPIETEYQTIIFKELFEMLSPYFKLKEDQDENFREEN